MKTGIYLLSLAAIFITACGGDSGTESSSGDPFARVETIYDLGECETYNEGVAKRVESEGRFYVCRKGAWQPEEEKVSSGNSGVSSQKSEIQSSSTVSKKSDNLSSSSFVELATNLSSNGSSESSTVCEGSEYDAASNTLKDCRDGKVYRTTTIAPAGTDYSEVWMAENLYYETADSHCDRNGKYGCFYTWLVAVGKTYAECIEGCGSGTGDVRGICPQGWHLPSKAEWEALTIAIDGSITEYASNNMAGYKLKSTSGWWGNYNGSDDYSFSAFPAGFIHCGTIGCGENNDEGNNTYFWSSTAMGLWIEDYAYYIYLYYDDDSVHLLENGSKTVVEFSVRCVMD